MEPRSEKPWRRNAPNDLIVTSILAAISAIVVQTLVTSGEPKYWTFWVMAAFLSLFLFVISAERAGESIREDDIKLYIWSMVIYNIGVLFLFLSLCAIFSRYTDSNAIWSIIIVMLLWLWFWGRDTIFLIFPGDHHDRWKRRMDGEEVEGEILDQYDILLTRIRFWRH